MKYKLTLLSLFLLSVISGVVLAVAFSFAAQPTGAPNVTPNITIDGGNRGNVRFPHQKHIDALGDCNVCHELYPTTAGIIEKLKKQGELKKKAVMNSQCTKCHRKRKKAGEPAGPTTCSTCHAR